MKTLAAMIWSLMISPAVWAGTFSDASLSGIYAFHLANPQTAVWSKTFSCPTNSTIKFTVNGGDTTEIVTTGTLTFQGNGSWNASFIEIGHIDTTASANTTSVTWNSSCGVVSTNNGSVVYKASSTGTAKGTYSVQANGTGTLSGSTSTGGTANLAFILGESNASGIATVVLLNTPQQNGHEMFTGIAVHQ